MPTLMSVQRLAYSLAEAEALSGLSRSTLYRLMAAGVLKTVHRGRRRLVPKEELERLCQPDAASKYPRGGC
jgi:excisionase family DNA binding protein